MTSLDKKYPDLASTGIQIQGVFKNFHSESGFQKVGIRLRIHRIRMGGALVPVSIMPLEGHHQR